MTGIWSLLRWANPILRRTSVPPPESTPRPFTISRGAAGGRSRAPAPLPRAARGGPATPPTGTLRPYRLASTPGRATSSPPHRPLLSPEGGPAMKDADVAPVAGAPTGDANPSVGSTLLERLRAGQTDAWERLARLYGPTVYVWCRSAGVPEADAADFSQEVLAAVARHLAEFRRERPGDSFRVWLWTITLKGSSRARESSAPRARIRWPTSIPDGASEQPSLSRAIGDDERGVVVVG